MITNVPRNNQVRPVSADSFAVDSQKKQETKPPIKTAFTAETKPTNLKLVIPSAVAIFFLFSAILVSYFIVVLAIGKPSILSSHFLKLNFINFCNCLSSVSIQDLP